MAIFTPWQKDKKGKNEETKPIFESFLEMLGAI